jgi:hypothetical protein
VYPSWAYIPPRLSVFLTLVRLQIDSYEREEHLLFSGFDDDGASLDHETMEKLFGCEARAEGKAIPATVQQRLEAEAERHAKATVSRSLEQSSVHFNKAREKLEKWADDMVLSAEKALLDTKEQIKALRRQSRQAVTLEEQHTILEKIQKLERQQRRQRQEIFAVEDEIMVKRDTAAFRPTLVATLRAIPSTTSFIKTWEPSCGASWTSTSRMK